MKFVVIERISRSYVVEAESKEQALDISMKHPPVEFEDHSYGDLSIWPYKEETECLSQQ